MQLGTHLLVFRAQLLLRRENRRRRRRLAAELAAYRSPAELNDLYAVLDTYPDGKTAEIRQILHDQQTYRTRAAR
jgi:hypothetical protein